MKKAFYKAVGMPLFRLPVTKSDRVNRERRNIADLGTVTASRALSETGIRPDAPLTICGRQAKALPVLRQLVRQSPLPFLLIGSRRDLSDESCLLSLPHEWTVSSPSASLPSGSGIMVLPPGAQTMLFLKENLSDWDGRLVILCLGSGLQADQELLNLLNGLGNYIILTESLFRSVKGGGDLKLSPRELLAGMEYILISSIGSAAGELISILPYFECEKVTDTEDISLHRHSLPMGYGAKFPQNGGGLHLGQARNLETKPILSQDELTRMQDQNIMLLYNVRLSHTWTARISL